MKSGHLTKPVRVLNQNGRKKKTPTISLLVPTRGRPEVMSRFLASVASTASQPDNIEIISVLDEDDHTYEQIDYHDLSSTQVVVKPGLTMGALNIAGYEASKGNFIMLVNDDVIARTFGWDDIALKTFNSYPDEIALIHVNDHLFEDNLCTFPFVTRRFCEIASGITRPEYNRYRIDDDIYHVFCMLAELGHKRIIYMPDVVFEHLNYQDPKIGPPKYIPDALIHRQDTKLFEDNFEKRKELALLLYDRIASYRQTEYIRTLPSKLNNFRDPNPLRRPQNQKRVAQGAPTDSNRVTVGLVSANIHNAHSRIAIQRLKEHTQNFDLVILDNNNKSNFNHSREMNRLLETCRTEYLILMDDDVWVQPNWKSKLLACLKPDVGLVTPIHYDQHEKLSYCGVVMKPDHSGHHSHNYGSLKQDTASQTICSAIMLIDMNKIGHLRLDETFTKYFLDIDYGLRVWEAGYKVITTPLVACIHLAGATLTQGSQKSVQLYEAQRKLWFDKWIPTGRYAKVCKHTWNKEPDLRDVIALPETLSQLVCENSSLSIDDFLTDASERLACTFDVPVLQQYMREVLLAKIGEPAHSAHDPEIGKFILLYGLAGGTPVKINSDFYGSDIYLFKDRVFGVRAGSEPPGEFTFDEQFNQDSYPLSALPILRSHLASRTIHAQSRFTDKMTDTRAHGNVLSRFFRFMRPVPSAEAQRRSSE